MAEIRSWWVRLLPFRSSLLGATAGTVQGKILRWPHLHPLFSMCKDFRRLAVFEEPRLGHHHVDTPSLSQNLTEASIPSLSPSPIPHSPCSFWFSFSILSNRICCKMAFLQRSLTSDPLRLAGPSPASLKDSPPSELPPPSTEGPLAVEGREESTELPTESP